VTAPLITVCVSTRNRAALLSRLLDALTHQALAVDDFEVIVVNDGSTDDTATVLGEFEASGRLRLRSFSHETSKGPAAGRNAAWQAASAPYIAFTDDDCVPTSEWLRAGYSQIAASGSSVVVGSVLPNPDQLTHAGPFAHTWTIRKHEIRGFATANIFYRREDLESLGGFDERYKNPACEDTDLGLRAEAAGIAVAYCAEALAWHDVRPDGVLGKIRDQRRWEDLPLVFREHPSARKLMLHRGLFWKKSHAHLLLLMAGLLVLPMSRRAALAAATPWLHSRLCPNCSDYALSTLAQSLPGQLAVDLAEIRAMVEGSVRHRSLVL
jgi:glycosyltransferase involved in cell wall biosynthesis